MDTQYAYKKQMFREIQSTLMQLPTDFEVLEEPVDVNLQTEYFNYVKNGREKIQQSQLSDKIKLLFDTRNDNNKLKKTIAELASIEKVEAYRALEKFSNISQHPLHAWGVIALQESRMLLRSEFLDEKQVYISTGLGGKHQRLRYFAVILHKELASFSEFEKRVFQSEFVFYFEKAGIEFEEIRFHNGFVTLQMLLPVKIELEELFLQATRECNSYGEFLSSDVILTNIRKICNDEIRAMINERNRQREQLPE